MSTTRRCRAESASDPRAFTRQDADAVYTLAEEPSALGLKVRDALNVVEKALQLYSINNLALSFNGGKDCTVLVHLLASSLLRLSASSSPSPSALPPIPTIYVRQPSPFPQEEKFTSICAERYHLELEAVEGKSMKDSLTVWMDRRKERRGQEVKAVLVGTRRTDPHGAKLTAFDPTDPTWPKFIRVHPILDWSYHEIWQFLRHPKLTLGGGDKGVEWCELYDYGYTSIGSTHNTFPNPCLRQTPSTTPPSSSSSSLASSPSTSAPTSTTASVASVSSLQVGSWLPAWELEDETQERAGREVSLGQVEKKAGQLRDEAERREAGKENGPAVEEEQGRRRIEDNGTGSL
ncbi:hypothetical protein JCM11491_005298 [Sporobolomyces phaffii]